MDGNPYMQEGVDHALKGGPQQAENLAMTLSGRFNEALGEGEGQITAATAAAASRILEKNGFTATASTNPAVAMNNLLATKFANETSEQAFHRRLQAAAIALKSTDSDHWSLVADLLDPNGGIGHELTLKAIFQDATGKDAYGPENPNLE